MSYFVPENCMKEHVMFERTRKCYYGKTVVCTWWRYYLIDYLIAFAFGHNMDYRLYNYFAAINSLSQQWFCNVSD